MSKKIVVDIPINRVEGDLEVKVEIADNRVVDAWCSGTMFRGFETILKGRGALDGLVITPRICGICGTGHLTAASRALDSLLGAELPANAVRLRNTALMVEHVQSDLRHFALMFMADLCNPAHRKRDFFAEAVARYEPLKGRVALEAIRETKKVLEVVAILGGQWPHSSFMVPGGVVSLPSSDDLLQCLALIQSFRSWYERLVLGCDLERVAEISSLGELELWRNEAPVQRDSELGFYLRVAEELDWASLGSWEGNFVSFGSLEIPAGSTVRGRGGDLMLPAGFARGTAVESFDHLKITEHVAHSWYRDYEGGRHPLWGETRPFASGSERSKYSWAKAVRYDDLPAETGPLAEMVVAGEPLFAELAASGPSVMSRELARIVRPVHLLPALETWVREMLAAVGDPYYVEPGEPEEGEGVGLTHASRGALGHWIRLKEGQIDHYQIITPTAWHASPRDSAGRRGPFEEALIGTRVADPDNPVEVGHVIRSFDACLVCTVHTLGRSSRTRV